MQLYDRSKPEEIKVTSKRGANVDKVVNKASGCTV